MDMLNKILKALSQNETTLVANSYFRVVLEEHLTPLVEKQGVAKKDSFDKVQTMIDYLEEKKDNPEELKESLGKLLSQLGAS